MNVFINIILDYACHALLGGLISAQLEVQWESWLSSGNTKSASIRPSDHLCLDRNSYSKIK